MIISVDDDNEADVPGAHFGVKLDGKAEYYVRKVDSEKLTYHVYDMHTKGLVKMKARYIGIFLRDKMVEILSAVPVPDPDAT